MSILCLWRQRGKQVLLNRLNCTEQKVGQRRYVLNTVAYACLLEHFEEA